MLMRKKRKKKLKSKGEARRTILAPDGVGQRGMGLGQRTGVWETGSPLSMEQRKGEGMNGTGREIVRMDASRGTGKDLGRQEG